ncbi:DUF397 domain-containing protein [Streptomyces sp. PRKS01-65]|nr:DUF397 domain-containing protein [Streptomyces harenosi]NEY35378.1 DUF397 domain-containing protein [Streptomyces harenosi]
MPPEPKWTKSSYSSNDGPDCVEVAMAPTAPAVHVRDSKDVNGARLTFAGASWARFLAFAGER